MANPFDEAFTQSNPIVAAATRIRARREADAAVDGAASPAPQRFEDAEAALAAFAEQLRSGVKRLNAILGERTGVTYVRLLRPLRVRLRFRGKRVGLDLDEMRQLVRISGGNLDGEWQFDPNAETPSLINLSKLSTESGYGEPLTAPNLLRLFAQDAELPRPPHLDAPGPLRF
ncbi:MAG: hypothetical protein ACYDDQ_05650 [Vulcanimicrobiaceae bacterium]